MGALPEQSVIDQYKGKIDFYYWRSIPCARKWPVHKPRWRSPEERQSSANFAYAAALHKTMSPSVIAAYQALPSTITFTWRDWIVRSYISGIDYRDKGQPWWLVPVIPNKFAVLDFSYRYENNNRVICWKTDKPCMSVMLLARFPPVASITQRERRGILHFADPLVYFQTRGAAYSYPWALKTEHETSPWAEWADRTTYWVAYFFTEWDEWGNTNIARSNSPIFTIPPAP